MRSDSKPNLPESNVAANRRWLYNGESIVKRYAEGVLSFHVHIAAVAPYAVEHFSRAALEAARRASSQLEVVLEVSPHFNQVPVLVRVGDALESFRPLDSFVRLVLLDSAYVRVRNASQESVPLAAKSGVGRFDWDLRSLLNDAPGVVFRKFINQVIERRPEIMDAVADCQAKTHWDVCGVPNPLTNH
jgi:hypothetical protein